MLARLEKLAAEVNYQHALDGLALFVNRDMARKFYLPFTIQERTVVDETFATRDPVSALNRSPRYWVLALSEKPTRLYEGLHDIMVEFVEGGFPMSHEGRGATLLVEEGDHCPARVDASGYHLTPADNPTAPDVIDDAVDEVIETVLANEGRVGFVDDGALKLHQCVALILRC